MTTNSTLTFDQANAEITANGSAIAQSIRAQQDAGDPAAKQLIDLFTGAITEPDPTKRQAATVAFLGEYETWRGRFAELVGPTAAQFGHPTPGVREDGTALGTPPQVVRNLFEPPAAAVAAIPEAAAVAAGPAGDPATDNAQAPPTKGPEAPANAVSSPAGAVSKSRKAWSQAAIAGLTRAVLMAPNGDVSAALDVWAGQSGGSFNAGDAAAKAIELELIAAPPQPKVYDLSQAEKDELEVRVSQHLVDPNAAPAVRLVQLKFCAQVLREEIKTLAG